MKIDWDDVPDQRPKASTVHGWLAKMRGTLLGDERLRSRGMREMKEARAIRAYKREKNAQRKASAVGRSPGMLFFFANNKRSSRLPRRTVTSSSRDNQRPRPRNIPSTHQIPARARPPSRPGYQRRGTSSRQHSYNSHQYHNSGTRSRPRRTL